MKYLISVVAIALLPWIATTLYAENTESSDSRGYVTAGFETNTNWYQTDLKTSATVPDGRFGSNNHLKLDYYKSKFSAGMQLEAYAPALVGYSADLKGVALTNFYVDWNDEDFSVTAGTFYDQFGSGLLFRSWEDRAIGLNNAITGARVTYSFKDILNVRALWGMPRYGMKFSETQVKGADLSFVLSNLIDVENTYIAMEGSVLMRLWMLTVSLTGVYLTLQVGQQESMLCRTVSSSRPSMSMQDRSTTTTLHMQVMVRCTTRREETLSL